LSRINEIRQRLSELQPEIVRLSAEETITPEDNELLGRQLAEFDTLSTELAPLEVREAQIEKVRNATIGGTGDGPTINRDVHIKRSVDDVYDLDRSAFWGKDADDVELVNSTAAR
jgi:hypothetical protein